MIFQVIMENVICLRGNGLKTTQRTLPTQMQLAPQFQYQKIVSCMGGMTRSSYIGNGSQTNVSYQGSNPRPSFK